MFLGFHDVINIVLAFLTNKAPFSAIFQILSFLTQIRKDYAMFVTCTKNETICETGSINMLIRADKACQFTDFFILHHYDVITTFFEN